MIPTKKVTAFRKDGSKRAQWTNTSEKSLEDWKKKPIFKDCTFSELEDNPNYAKETKREAIKAVLSEDDLWDLVLALVRANPAAIPEDIRTKVQEALQA